ncbi:hypothetical protein [Nonomuraea cypriaca]|uniref:hypothetical protein n=1 Tax=Nonomuraea cypriaca TaxID=1187855 RepID=UPI002E282264|nr:hypothetical protein [Nonomuraea cypriaca]
MSLNCPCRLPPNVRGSASAVHELHPSDHGEQGIRRVRRGRGFGYERPGGRPVRDRATLERIKALAIPPAWADVWICRSPRGHLQAVGTDAAGRPWGWRCPDRPAGRGVPGRSGPSPG